jgi:hypothetical protein
MAMTKRKAKLEDGRYIVYFEFDKMAAPADASGRVVAAAPSRPRPARRPDTTTSGNAARRPDATDSAAAKKGGK